MEELIPLAGAGVGGGLLGAAFGAVGSIAGRVMGLFELREKRRDRQLEMAHEKDRWSHEGQAAALDRQAEASRAEQALRLAQSSGSWQGLSASIAAEAAIGESYPWVAALRALTRPALTLLLWLLFGLLFCCALGGAMAAETSDQVIRTAVETVSFSASTALAWWFGDRAPRRDG